MHRNNMLYPEGLMHRKINFGLALLIIFVIAGIFAWIISARAVSLPGIGLVVISPAVPCTLDPGTPPPGTCTVSCPTCGSLIGICAGLWEVKARFLSGSPVLFQGAGGPALCLTSPIPPTFGSFRPGGQCIGNITGFGPHFLQNFACF